MKNFPKLLSIIAMVFTTVAAKAQVEIDNILREIDWSMPHLMFYDNEHSSLGDERSNPTLYIIGDWNIWGEHRQLKVAYDMDGETYTRRVYLQDLSDTNGPDSWMLWDTQSGMTGSGTETIDLFDVPHGPTFKAEIRLIEQGSVNALLEPRPQTEPFTTWDIPIMIVDDTPICDGAEFMFTVDVTEYGYGYPYDLAKLYMYIRNTTLDIDYDPIVHELSGTGSMTTENFWIELIDPGNYEICYELTIEDVGFDPDWGPETVINTCSDPLQFSFDISTGISLKPKPKEVLGLTAYPNPTIDYVRVQNAVIGARMIVTDDLGQVVIEKRAAYAEELLEIPNLPAGTYTISQPGTGLSTRVVKQ